MIWCLLLYFYYFLFVFILRLNTINYCLTYFDNIIYIIYAFSALKNKKKNSVCKYIRKNNTLYPQPVRNRGSDGDDICGGVCRFLGVAGYLCIIGCYDHGGWRKLFIFLSSAPNIYRPYNGGGYSYWYTLFGTRRYLGPLFRYIFLGYFQTAADVVPILYMYYYYNNIILYYVPTYIIYMILFRL